jgi:hypothetical protein
MARRPGFQLSPGGLLSVMSANEKKVVTEECMCSGCVISGFARKHWLRGFEYLSYRSYKQGSFHFARRDPPRVTKAGIECCEVRGNDGGVAGYTSQVRPRSAGREEVPSTPQLRKLPPRPLYRRTCRPPPPSKQKPPTQTPRRLPPCEARSLSDFPAIETNLHRSPVPSKKKHFPRLRGFESSSC